MDHHNPHSSQTSASAHPAVRPAMTGLFFFIVPALVIAGLVSYLVAPPGHGVSLSDAAGAAQLSEAAVSARIQKVGTVSLRDAARQLSSGEGVFKAQCTTCHTAGVVGAPKLGDAAAWAPRIKTGFDALLTSALKGKGAMGAQGGGNFEDIEVARAVVYMANAAGATFAEPAAPQAAASAPVAAAK